LLKFGAYFQFIIGVGQAGHPDRGLLAFAASGANSTGNAYADMLIGRPAAYRESTKNLVNYLRQKAVAHQLREGFSGTAVVVARWPLDCLRRSSRRR
jgi:hypothetical protein